MSSNCEKCGGARFVDQHRGRPVAAPSARDLKAGTVVRCPSCNPAVIDTVEVRSTPAVGVEDQPPREVVVVARNPQEMLVAQQRLIAWADRKAADSGEEVLDAATNLETAIQAGWKTDSLERLLQRAERRKIFYSKVRAALVAGFVIVPNMPMDVFAIRTTKARPRRNEVSVSNERWPHSVRAPDVQTPDLQVAGEGRYVAPQAKVETEVELQKIDEQKNQRFLVTRWADDFQELDFPFSAARPEVLNATQQALALKIFDDVGVSPPRHREVRAGAGMTAIGDPMVIGRVMLRGRGGSRFLPAERAVSFLITWFVDSRDL